MVPLIQPCLTTQAALRPAPTQGKNGDSTTQHTVSCCIAHFSASLHSAVVVFIKPKAQVATLCQVDSVSYTYTPLSFLQVPPSSPCVVCCPAC